MSLTIVDKDDFRTQLIPLRRIAGITTLVAALLIIGSAIAIICSIFISTLPGVNTMSDIVAPVLIPSILCFLEGTLFALISRWKNLELMTLYNTWITQIQEDLTSRPDLTGKYIFNKYLDQEEGLGFNQGLIAQIKARFDDKNEADKPILKALDKAGELQQRTLVNTDDIEKDDDDEKKAAPATA